MPASVLVDRKKSSPDDFFETLHGLRRKEARFLPPAPSAAGFELPGTEPIRAAPVDRQLDAAPDAVLAEHELRVRVQGESQGVLDELASLATPRAGMRGHRHATL